MSSQSQIDANRLNAQKSTGPVSPEGKAASSLNALKSGIHADYHIIRGENPAELEALTTAFLLHHKPADPNQLALVDTLISYEWTQRRLRRVEAELWAYEREILDRNLSHADFIDAAIQHNSPLGHSYKNAFEALNRLQRRIESTNRMYLRTLQVLQDLQKAPVDRAAQPAAPSPEPWSPLVGDKQASPEETQPLTSQIGFVPPFTAAPAERPHRTERPALAKHEPAPKNSALPKIARPLRRR